jgi:ATP-dependent RNA helicase DDX56/DBP9
MDSGLLDKSTSFASLGVDARLIKALNKTGIHHPTVIQSQSLPTTLAKKDVLLCSNTGSGKTLAYVLPVLHNILNDESSNSGTCAIVLVPTRELTRQVGSVIAQMVAYCWDKIDVVDLSGDFNSAAEGVRLKEMPKVVVGTPGKIVNHCRLGNLNLKTSLQYLVVDEADLILSFGYDNDIKELLTFCPKLLHTMLMSATLSPEIDALKRLVLNKPAIFKLKHAASDEKENEDGEEDGDLPEVSMLVQHHILDLSEHPANDAYLYIYTLVKLNAIKGKTLFFVNDIDAGYRLKLFFESFSIRSAILNAELPVRTRLDTVKQFNNGTVDFLIATDKGLEEGFDQIEHSQYHEAEQSEDDDEDEEMDVEEVAKMNQQVVEDKDFGVSRGVDFHGVVNVVNFNFPTSLKSYVHRVGRTGRAGERGTAVSIVTDKDYEILEKVQEYYRLEMKSRKIQDQQEAGNMEDAEESMEEVLRPLNVRYKDVAAFKYRVDDIIRGVNANAVKKARLKEIHLAMLRSEKLKAHFEDNPREKELLKSGTILRPRKVLPHLKAVPKYLVSENLESIAISPANSGRFAPIVRASQKRRRRVLARRNDPLKTFSSAVPEAGKVMKRIKNRKKLQKILN